MASSRHNQRLPAPSLFVGPPSQNASTTSLRQTTTRGEQSSQDNKPTSRDYRQPSSGGNVQPAPGKLQRTNTAELRSRVTSRDGRGAADREGERTEAAWAEMQNTLEEVELNAASGGNAFSADHARALEDLRKAQIALAEAWARSEGEDESMQQKEGGLGTGGAGTASSYMSEDAHLGGGSVSGRARSGSTKAAPGQGGKTQLEEDTDNDILLARKRREANDKYFERVNKGVVDVVGKLEDVARKMRGVEMEAQDIWSEGSSSESDSDSS
ncbi:MAG: hypothetical protein M1831_003271 [Alyxoria varia]|nr:MAG: hypothetical protein M1831_003271 [Alyxoria varia]